MKIVDYFRHLQPRLDCKFTSHRSEGEAMAGRPNCHSVHILKFIDWDEIIAAGYFTHA